MSERVAVILPTYDEVGNILSLVEDVRTNLARAGYSCEVVVVDDNSPDGTGRAVQQRYTGDPEVRTIIRATERGIATAIRTGIDASQAPIVVVMDTDYNHDPADVPVLVRGLDQADLVVGSRFLAGGGMEDQLRYWLSRLYNVILCLVIGSRVTDNLSGFFAIHRQHLEDLPLDRILFASGDFYIRLLYAAQRQGFRIKEVPVYYDRRRYGKSKTRFLDIFMRYTRVVLGLRWRGLPLPPAGIGAP
jgi:dolichol-phosphate mannosyltransferase